MFDFKCLSALINLNVEKRLSSVSAIHHRKLKNLGIDLSKKVDANKIIFNFSDRILTDKEKNVLSLGLDFGLRPRKSSFANFFVHFERTCQMLKNCNIYKDTINTVFNKISALANDMYVQHCRESVHSPDHTEQYSDVLQNLKDDGNIVITRPDKGKGIVILNKNDYYNKISSILSDSSKFKLLHVDLPSHLLKLEDKLNRILRPLKETINETIYNSILASGSRPGYLYGLPKVHKIGTPLRPIVSSINTFNYNLAKFLVKIIQPLTINEYTTANTLDFVEEIKQLNIEDSTVMASFDVESLFTNVPLSETTQIITDSISDESISQFGLNKKQFNSFLNIATRDSVFTFDNNLYTQIDGVAMGSPLGPSYANAFLCHHECNWLNNCPNDFKPIFYKRYIDDTFLLFKQQSHIDHFLSYLNDQHPNIKFTCEIEKENELPFLDTLISKENGRLSTTVYRKPTFTGLGMNFLSFSPMKYKINSIATLINRAFNICSTWMQFDKEMKFLVDYFNNNGYPDNVFYKTLRSFLDNKLCPPTKIQTAPKETKYIKLPYLGHISFTIRKQLREILKHSFPQIKFNIVFVNSYNINSFFKMKMLLPSELCSNIVYIFNCPRCNARYIGSSTRWFKHRILEHMGKSIRTSLPLSRPSFSAIRHHSQTEDHPFTHSDFKILSSTPNRLDLLILESLHTHKMKPELNANTAIQLLTV